MGPRPLATAAACTLAGAWAAACGGHDVLGGSCSAAVRWQGAVYVGNVTGTGLPPTGPAVTPRPTDLGCVGNEPHPVDAHQLRGVAPALALRKTGFEGTTLLPEGVYTQLPGHPLHDAYWGSRSAPARRPDGKRCRARGTVRYRTTLGFELKTDDGDVLRVLVDARTRIAGAPARGGQPLIPDGATVDVRGRRCAADGNLDGRLTALRVAVA